MNIKNFLKGPYRKAIKFGEVAKTRCLVNRTHGIISRVEIAYSEIEFTRTYYFPWVKSSSKKLWYLQIEIATHTGRVFKTSTTSELDLVKSIDNAFHLGVEYALSSIRNAMVDRAVSRLG